MWNVQLQMLPQSSAVIHSFQLVRGGEGANVGRSASKSQVVVESHFKATSRCHAMLSALPADGGIVIQDRGALNGVFVNGVRVGRALLADGDVLTFGSTEVDAAAVAMNARLPTGSTAAHTAMFVFSATRLGPAPSATAVQHLAAPASTASGEMKLSVMDRWTCPFCRSNFASVLVKTAARWTETDGHCPRCPTAPGKGRAPAVAAKRQRLSNTAEGANRSHKSTRSDASGGGAVLTDETQLTDWAEDAARAGTAMWQPAAGRANGVTCRGCGAAGCDGGRLTDAGCVEYLKLAEPAISRQMTNGHGCYSAAMLTAEALRVLLEHEHCASAALEHLQSAQYSVPEWMKQFEGWSS
jgi:hypothetical protein